MTRNTLPHAAPRAALYARFSTDMQRDASIEDQLRGAREHAARLGCEVVAVYEDRAVSGASLIRSGLQALLRDAQAGHFDVVITEALDRLSRSQADIAMINDRLCFQGIRIDTISEGGDLPHAYRHDGHDERGVLGRAGEEDASGPEGPHWRVSRRAGSAMATRWW